MNGASLMDEIGKIANLGKCKTATGPCRRVNLAWWSFRRRRLLHKPVKRGNAGREGAVWSCHKVSFLGRVGTKVCTKMRSWRLCRAAGRCEHCQGRLRGRVPSGLLRLLPCLAPCRRPGRYLFSCRQGSCVPLPSDMDFLRGPRRAALLFQAKLCSQGKLEWVQGFVWFPF